MFDYNKAPTQKVFDDIKSAALAIWRTYDDTYGYQSEKVNRIKDLKNISDNYGYIVGMFDSSNQNKLFQSVKLPETKELLKQLICADESGLPKF
jgi:hypothetical protein